MKYVGRLGHRFARSSAFWLLSVALLAGTVFLLGTGMALADNTVSAIATGGGVTQTSGPSDSGAQASASLPGSAAASAQAPDCKCKKPAATPTDDHDCKCKKPTATPTDDHDCKCKTPTAAPTQPTNVPVSTPTPTNVPGSTPTQPTNVPASTPTPTKTHGPVSPPHDGGQPSSPPSSPSQPTAVNTAVAALQVVAIAPANATQVAKATTVAAVQLMSVLPKTGGNDLPLALVLGIGALISGLAALRLGRHD